MKKTYLLTCLTLLTSCLTMPACSEQTTVSSTAAQPKPHTDIANPARNITNMSHIYITTKDKQAITSKDEYLQASINIEGQAEYADFAYSGDAKIRGRGNSTWARAKKPYKIKLDKKVSLFGLQAEKDWVLLANHFDPTLMLNATAMKIGQQLGIDYINHIVPVDVTINGKYNGQYNLTEQVEVKKKRVNIKGGILLELDRYFNDDYKFKSKVYKLPINFKYPKHVDDELMAGVQQDVHTLETLLAATDFPNNNYGDYFDKNAFATYFIVYMFTANREMEQPKSIYMHKQTDNGKFIMGPIWDFDWGFGFVDGEKAHFSEYQQVLFDSKDDGIGDGLTGSVFFARILQDPEVAALVQQKWQDYRKHHFANLLAYLDDYQQKQLASRQQDYELWQTGSGDFDADYQRLRTWLEQRAEFLDGYVAES